MASVLQTPWIRRVVEEKLKEIIRWRGVDGSDRTKDGYQIVGDSVLVKMGGAKPLQIVAIGTYEGEPRLLLSDTASSIEATFSITALDADRTTTGRFFTDATVGGVIGVSDYELRVRWSDTALPPKLVAHVRRASYLGSGGEGTFGKPIYILDDRRINELLVIISTLCFTDSETMGDAESLVQSQHGDGQLGEELQELRTDEGTQNEFATQVHQSRQAPSSRPSGLSHNSGLGVTRHGSASVMTAVGISAKVKERAGLNDLSIFLPRGLGRGIRVAAGVTQKSPKSLSSMSEKGIPGNSDGRDVRFRDPAPVEITRVTDLVPGSVALIQAPAMDDTNRLTIGPVEADGRTGRAEGVAMDGDNSSQGSQECLAEGGDFETSPWAGMTRISRREARVPEDQDELLSGKNCWIPAEPGSRNPVANIPVPILRALAAKAEELAMRGKEASEAAKNHIEEDLQFDSGSSSASDTEMELEWSQSPDRPRYVPVDEMPIDSSPVEASLSNSNFRSGAAKQLLNQGGPMSRRRKHEETNSGPIVSSPIGASLANSNFRSGAAKQLLNQGSPMSRRGKHEESISDNQESSPTTKRQRKGGNHEEGLRSEQKCDGDYRSRGSPQRQSVKSLRPPTAWRGSGTEASPPANGKANGRLVETLELRGRECDNVHLVGESVSDLASDSTSSPVGNGTQASQHSIYQQAYAVGVVEAEPAEPELEIDSNNGLRRPEHSEACVYPIVGQVPSVINTQDRPQTSDGAIGEPDADEEHELETSFPAALGDGADGASLGYNESLYSQLAPMGSQPQKPVVQIKLTPHLRSQGPERPCTGNSLVSQMGTHCSSLHNGKDSSSDMVIPSTFPHTATRVSTCKYELATDDNFDEDSALISSQIETELRRHYPQLCSLNEMSGGARASHSPETGLSPRGLERADHGPKSIGGLDTQASGFDCPPRPPSEMPATKPSRKGTVASASVSSYTPLKALLSSPAHMKAKVPSSVLDWLEKTSSVGSESADNVSDPQEQKWWHDRNTPFKEWCRAYVSLKSVRGAMGKVDRETGNIITPPMQMDVLNWSLS